MAGASSRLLHLPPSPAGLRNTEWGCNFLLNKYILQFETNTLCNLRQIHFAIWDKYRYLYDVRCSADIYPVVHLLFLWSIGGGSCQRCSPDILRIVCLHPLSITKKYGFKKLKEIQLRNWKKYSWETERNPIKKQANWKTQGCFNTAGQVLSA